MKKSKMSTWQLVVITWIDSTQRSTPWWTSLELEEDIKEVEKTDYFLSSGYLFKTTKDYFYLATSIHFEDNKAVSFGTIFNIPRGCVKKIEKL